MFIKTFLSFAFSIAIISFAAAQNPALTIKQPAASSNKVSSSKQFIVGNTCAECTVTINNIPVKVYSTGSFALQINVQSSDSNFVVSSTNDKNKTVSKIINYSYQAPQPEKPVTTTSIEYIKISPEGNLVVSTGDKIDIKVKALPGSKLTTVFGELNELPLSQTGGMAGIYNASYIFKESDAFSKQKLKVNLTSPAGEKTEKESKDNFASFSTLASDMVITKGSTAHLNYGLGTDRLGGAKSGFLVEGIPLKITGKVGSDYKVRLAKNQIAYISEDDVTLLQKGTIPPQSLTDSWRVSGDDKYDFVTIGLDTKLPYQSRQLINPSKIEIDIFGATNNTNWITQMQTAKEVENVDYEQVAEDIYRVTIYLKHATHWGHSIYYNGNNLVVKVKQQPKNLTLQNLTVAVDAGHGGSNSGAYGYSGSSEKMIALSISIKLQKLLAAAGAKVIMTRTQEMLVPNGDRIAKYKAADPDLLVSIHLNSAADPINAGGTSSMYKYVGFRSLSQHIHKRMLELGLKEYGNIGSFNFVLNSPTEYINALVETLFISNLEEEAQVMQDSFQQKIAEKIFLGIKDFLADAADR